MNKIKFKKRHIHKIQTDVKIYNFATPWQEDNTFDMNNTFYKQTEEITDISDDLFIDNKKSNEFWF